MLNVYEQSLPEFRRCSPKSQPNTLSFKIPDCFNVLRVGLDNIKDRKNDINLPCFLKIFINIL